MRPQDALLWSLAGICGEFDSLCTLPFLDTTPFLLLLEGRDTAAEGSRPPRDAPDLHSCFKSVCLRAQRAVSTLQDWFRARKAVPRHTTIH
mmetsp:Transcript_6660/g.24698  ORF Transcript_6660/g.24698 Transcript_6660/m.24698 type:complete len:91 (+) Transcript_6660:2416-2688(+)